MSSSEELLIKQLEEQLNITGERARKYFNQIKEMIAENAVVAEQEVAQLEAQNNPQMRREERREEHRQDHRQEEVRDQLIHRIVSLALRAKNDPALQERLTHMPVMGKAMNFVQQAQSTAPKPFDTRNFTPFRTS
jgi:flagellar biosynthesis GTPase FlhF